MPGLVSLHSPTPSEGGDRFADYVGLLRHNTSKSGDVQISLREDVDASLRTSGFNLDWPTPVLIVLLSSDQ